MKTTRASGVTQTDLLYTGQREEPGDAAGLGLYNYKARFYSTLTGRFVSADPVQSDKLDPQFLNRFAYVRNSPLSHRDPSGLCILGLQCEAADILRFLQCGIQFTCDTSLASQENMVRLSQWAMRELEFFENVQKAIRSLWWLEAAIKTIRGRTQAGWGIELSYQYRMLGPGVASQDCCKNKTV